MSSKNKNKRISPAAIGEYLSFDQCSRFYQHRVKEIETIESHDSNEFTEAFNPLNVLLAKTGEEFEEDIFSTIARDAVNTVDLSRDEDTFITDHDEILELLTERLNAPPDDSPTVIYQPTVSGEIQSWTVDGHADFVLIWSTAPDEAEIRVIDAKSASEEKTYHQVQAAIYTHLIKNIADADDTINLNDVEFSAGVITRESDYTPLTPANVPFFEYETRIADVARLLDTGGQIQIAHGESLDTSPHQLDSKCTQCPYNEACSTATFESKHVRLLGVSESEQKLLEAHDVTSLSDLANLCAEPREWQWDPTEQKKASFQKPTYKELKSTPGLGEKLPNLVYRAQALEKKLDPDCDEFPAAWIPGTGKCDLPDDSPPEEFDFEYQRGSMIRVYLNVQEDHLRDKLIQLSAKVTATGSTKDAIHISELSKSAPTQEPQATDVEKDLLSTFISKVYGAIHEVADGIDLTETAQQHPLLHFYSYTSGEYDGLLEALDRHDSELVNSFQDALEGEIGVDRPRVSFLKPEVKSHVALGSASHGLLHAYDELQPPKNEYSKSRSADEWSYTPSYPNAPQEANLRQIFNRRLFNISVDWESNNGTIEVKPDEHKQLDGLKTRFRHGAEIPLGYQWAAIGRIDDQWVDDLAVDGGNGLVEYEIDSYRFHDATKKNHEIQIEDVEELGNHLCDVAEHVERSLFYNDLKLTEKKVPVDPTSLRRDTHTVQTIGQSAQDFLWLEHTTRQKEIYNRYRKLPIQRILSGSSLPVQILEVDEEKGNSLSIWVKGKLRYDKLFGKNENKVKHVCKRKGQEETSGGDWMVANPFAPGQTKELLSEPYELEKGVNATIKHINTREDIVEFELRNTYWPPGEFDSYHRNYTTDKAKKSSEKYTYIASGEWLILDPLTDNISADRANKALEHIDTNNLHDLLEDIRWGKDALSAPLFEQQHLETFAEWLGEAIPPETYPNDRQQKFVESTNQITLLQGPPGTGKTAGTTAPALCARMFAAEKQGQTTAGLVTAPSNTAIEEVLEDTAELLAKLKELGLSTLSEENVELVRLTNNVPRNKLENVEYVDYNHKNDKGYLRQMKNHLSGTTESLSANASSEESNAKGDSDDGQESTENKQATFTAFGGGSESVDSDSERQEESERTHTLVFATPTKSWGLLKHFASDKAETEDIAAQTYWNLVAIDEASMLTTPKLLLAGVGVEPHAQYLVSGDHRQLPPVQQVDWSNVKRRSIVETAPYLSALDYLRLLRGDSEDVLGEEAQEHFEGDISPTQNPIPLVQLDETYRFGPDTAAFIGESIYAKDGIQYTSARSANDIQPQHTATTPALSKAFEAGEVTLITYKTDVKYQQVNILEAALCQAILLNNHPNATAGLVTPHNAQRSRLREMLRNLEQNDNAPGNIRLGVNTHVETVERFQGGQQNLMLASATVSDPQLIRSESEFLLQKNRANVSFTRHEDKLIVIAAESLLSHIPSDPDIYDEAILWKQLPKEVGATPLEDGNAVWEGNLSEFVAPFAPPQSLASQNVSIKIYGL